MDDERDALPQGAPDRIESFLAEWRADEEIPGISAAVFGADGVRFAIGLGERDVETGEPATPDTLYSVASLSKPAVATAVLQLVERGVLDLDDEVREHVAVLDDAPDDPITIAELLSHASGIPRDFSAFYDVIDDGREPDVFEHIAGAAEHRLLDRDRFMYSNGGYYVLGEVIEAADGRPFDQYIDQEVFAPLGMSRSGYDPETLRSGDAMTGYVERDGELAPTTYDGGAGPSGGLISSPRELGTLGRVVLGNGDVDGSNVLDAGLVADACSLQSPELPTVDGSQRGYGYGWRIDEFAGQPLVSHLGGIDGAGAYVGILPDAGVGVTLAFNRYGPSARTIGRGLLAIARGENPEDAVRMIRVSNAIAAVTGSYESYRGAETATVESGPVGTIELTVDGRGLSFTAAPDEIEDDRYVFSTRSGNGLRWPVEFRGTPTGMELLVSTGKWTTVYTEQ